MRTVCVVTQTRGLGRHYSTRQMGRLAAVMWNIVLSCHGVNCLFALHECTLTSNFIDFGPDLAILVVAFQLGLTNTWQNAPMAITGAEPFCSDVGPRSWHAPAASNRDQEGQRAASRVMEGTVSNLCSNLCSQTRSNGRSRRMTPSKKRELL